MTKTSAKAPIGLTGLILAGVVLIVPGLQYMTARYRAQGLAATIVEKQRRNEELLKQIDELHESKTAAVASAVERIAALEDRLEQNRDLMSRTERASEKLVMVGTLTAEYRHLVVELNTLKAQFPELTSGE
jgi:hypothetical protein